MTRTGIVEAFVDKLLPVMLLVMWHTRRVLLFRIYNRSPCTDSILFALLLVHSS